VKTVQKELKVIRYTIPANPQVLFDVNQRLFCVPNVIDTRGGAHRLFIKPEGLILDNGQMLVPTPEIYHKIEDEYKYQCEIFVGTSTYKQSMLDQIIQKQDRLSKQIGTVYNQITEIKNMQNLGVYMEKFRGVCAEQPPESLKKLSLNNTAENTHEDKMGDKEQKNKDSKAAGANLPPPPPPAPKRIQIIANLPFNAPISSEPRSIFDLNNDTLDDVIKAYVSGKGYAVQTTEGMYTSKSLLEKLEKFDELKTGGKVEIHYAVDGIPYAANNKGEVTSVQTKDALYKRNEDTDDMFAIYAGADKEISLTDEKSKEYQTAKAYFEKAQKDLYDRTGIVIKKKDDAESEEEESIDDAVEEAPEKSRAPTARRGTWAKRAAAQKGAAVEDSYSKGEKSKGYLARFWDALNKPIYSGKPKTEAPEEDSESESPAPKKESILSKPLWGGKKPLPPPPSVRRPAVAPSVESKWRISPQSLKVASKVEDEPADEQPAPAPKKVTPPQVPPAEAPENEIKVQPVAVPPVDEEDAYECPKCGAKVGEADTKCKKCGAEFE